MILSHDFFFASTAYYIEKTLQKWYNITIEMSDKND